MYNRTPNLPSGDVCLFSLLSKTSYPNVKLNPDYHPIKCQDNHFIPSQYFEWKLEEGNKRDIEAQQILTIKCGFSWCISVWLCAWIKSPNVPSFAIINFWYPQKFSWQLLPDGECLFEIFLNHFCQFSSSLNTHEMGLSDVVVQSTLKLLNSYSSRSIAYFLYSMLRLPASTQIHSRKTFSRFRYNDTQQPNLLFEKEENKRVKKNYLSSLESFAKKEKGSERGTHKDYAQHWAMLMPQKICFGRRQTLFALLVSLWCSPAPKNGTTESCLTMGIDLRCSRTQQHAHFTSHFFFQNYRITYVCVIFASSS